MARRRQDLEEIEAIALASRLTGAIRALARRVSFESSKLDNSVRIAAAKMLLPDLFLENERRIRTGGLDLSNAEINARMLDLRDTLLPVIEREFHMKIDPEELWAPTIKNTKNPE